MVNKQLVSKYWVGADSPGGVCTTINAVRSPEKTGDFSIIEVFRASLGRPAGLLLNG